MAMLQSKDALTSFVKERWSEYRPWEVNVGNSNHKSSNNSFHQRINKCFKKLREKVKTLTPEPPLRERTLEEMVKVCPMLRGNPVLPIDWSKSDTQTTHNNSLCLRHQQSERPSLRVSNDKDSARAFDMDSLITNNLHPEEEDKLPTADEVISQIDSIMLLSEYGMTAEDEAYTTAQQTLPNLLGYYSQQELQAMSPTSLPELLAEYDKTTKVMSELLVSELAWRDELGFEKETMSQFISLLCTVHKKRRSSRREGKQVNRKRGVIDAKAHNLTVPYHPEQGPPSAEQLQVFIKILQAINEDSSDVPRLLTDYILTVMCPMS